MFLWSYKGENMINNITKCANLFEDVKYRSDAIRIYV